MREWIVGRNAVYETLRAHRRQLFRLRLAQGMQEKGRIGEVLQLAENIKLNVERVSRAQLDSLGEGSQGVALEASGYPYTNLLDVLDLSDQRDEPPFILVLDTLQDPQNLATLLRTAEGVGVHGVLLPFRRTATVTPAVVRVSAGASEHLFIVQCNLVQALTLLKEKGVWAFGLEDSQQAQDIGEVSLDGALALVVGNEGEGIRPLVRNSCDMLLRLPMRGRVESYNAAVAGSIALFLASSQRHPVNN